MITFMTGAIFQEKYLQSIDQLNQLYSKTKTTEVYGSLRWADSGLLTARPDFRLKQLSWFELELFIRECHKYNLQFNYTMNAPTTGSHFSLGLGLAKTIRAVKKLEEMGADRVTIANPLMMEIVQKNSCLPIEMSTILHINSLHQVEFYQAQPSVDSICLSLYRNRDISFVRKMHELCAASGIRLQVMATEFCSVGGAPCLGIYRAHCYDLHGRHRSKEEAKEFGNYPMGRCIFGRAGDKASWLKSRVIYPNELEEYSSHTKVDNFKITCRTAPPEFGLQLLEHYMKLSYEGNLMSLWMQLQTIQADQTTFASVQERSEGLTYIDCGKLSQPRSHGTLFSDRKFYDKWFDDPDFRCDDNDCAECGWCHDWAELC